MSVIGASGAGVDWEARGEGVRGEGAGAVGVGWGGVEPQAESARLKINPARIVLKKNRVKRNMLIMVNVF